MPVSIGLVLMLPVSLKKKKDSKKSQSLEVKAFNSQELMKINVEKETDLQ